MVQIRFTYGSHMVSKGWSIDLFVFLMLSKGFLTCFKNFSATGIETWPGTAKHVWFSSHPTIITLTVTGNYETGTWGSITKTNICKSWFISPKESKTRKCTPEGTWFFFLPFFPYVFPMCFPPMPAWASGRRGTAATSQWHALTSRIVSVWRPAWMAPASGLVKGT